MFGRIELRGFRGFESYRLDGLRRVNLLVGKNNSGKTSVLEALRLLAFNGNVEIIDEVTQYRSGHRKWVPSGNSSNVNIAPLFFNHRVSCNDEFSIETDNGSLSVKIILPTDSQQKFSIVHLDSWEDSTFDSPELAMQISIDGQSPDEAIFPIASSGLLTYRTSSPRWRFTRARCSSRFLTAQSLDVESLSPMWDDVLRKDRENHVIVALQTLQPDIAELHFLSHPKFEILAGINGEKYKVPLHSFGDGTRRFLVFSLILSNLEDGLLLVDEIDTGLHWTVMEDLWRLVIGAAREGNVQVFATTHSYDCVKGLASLLECEPELAEEVSLQKLERRLDKAVAFRGEQIPRAISHNIELR